MEDDELQASPVRLSEEPTDLETTIKQSIMYPTLLFGMMTNGVTLFVWSSQSAYHASTCLFRALAVSDLLFLFFRMVYTILRHPLVICRTDVFAKIFVSILAFGNRRHGLLISLTLATVRSIKLFFPTHAMRLLTPVRMKVTVGLLLLFGLTTETYDYYCRHLANETIAMCRYSDPWTKRVLAYLLPATLQILLMLVVLWKVWRQRAQINVLTCSSLGTSRQTTQTAASELTVKLEKRRPSHTSRQSEITYKHESNAFVYVVFAMCLASFVSFVVPSTIHVLLSQSGPEWHPYKRVAGFTMSLLNEINSGINFFFYLFIARFRSTLCDKWNNLRESMLPTTSYAYDTDTNTGRAAELTTRPAGQGKRGGDAEEADNATLSKKTSGSVAKTNGKKDDSTFISN